MAVDIRRAAIGDLGPVLELVAEYCDADGHPFDRTVAERGVGPLLTDDDHGGLWIAVADGETTGYAAVTWGWSIEIGGAEAVLDEIYVRRRGTGIGSLLIERVVATCRDRGMRRIFLETERPNAPARRLYERHGFVADDSIWMSKPLA